MGQRLLEQGLRLVRVSSGHGASVGDRGQCPRPARWPSAKPASSSTHRAGKVGFTGSYRCVDALDGGHPGQDREPEPTQVMEGAEGVSRRRRCADPLGPPGEVVHGVGQDAQRVRRHDLVEVAQAGRRSRPGPAARRAGSARPSEGRSSRAAPMLCPSASASSALVAHRSKVPGDEMAEAQPLEGVDHRRDGATVPGSRQRQRVETLLGMRRHPAAVRRCRGFPARRGRPPPRRSPVPSRVRRRHRTSPPRSSASWPRASA